MRFAYLFFPWINQRVAWWPTRLFLNLFIGLSVEGLENVRSVRERKVIFAANHTSELDPIVVTASVPYWSRFVPMFYVSRSKKDYRNSPPLKRLVYGGLFFKTWGAFPTFSGHKDYERSLTHHIRILNMNLPVLIFPEGGISRNGEKREPRGGITYMAQRTGAVIIPVHISNLADMKRGELYRRKRHCTVTFGTPVEAINNTSGSAEGFRKFSQEIVEEIYSLKSDSLV